MTEKVIWRDRVKEFRRVPASELRANPKNWREHPAEQRRALNGILEEVGIAGAVLARETEDGLELIDGHLRAEMDDATEWPVLVLDVNEAEADVLLASIDPIGAMASRSEVKLQTLLMGLSTENENLQTLINDLSNNTLVHEPLQPEDGTEQPMDFEYLVITRCESETRQIEAMNLLEKGGFPCKAQIV